MTDESNKETFSLRLEKEVWTKVKIHCATEELKISDYIKSLITKDLKGGK